MAAPPHRTGLLLPMPVWDIPTRLFHWALVVGVAACYVTDKLSLFGLHKICGETVLALVLFRLVWGFLGSDTARFRHFIADPRDAVRHLLHFHRRAPDTQIGHNAAGGWMVLVMLAILLAQTATGLFANDVDSFIAGPLAARISDDAGQTALHYHDLNFDLLKIVVLLHIGAVIAYAVVKRHNLVTPMISGRKKLPAATPAPRMAAPAFGAALFLACALGVWALVSLA